MNRLFFIVGRGRSGTTLLSRMLMRHPELCVAPEGFFVMNLRRRYSSGGWDRPRVQAFCRDLVLENRMKTWNLDLGSLAERLNGQLDSLDYAGVCNQVYLSYALSVCDAEPTLVGDKNPHYGLLARHIAQMFPQARFVFIVRDYRDNICSYKTVPFDMNQTAALAYRWRKYNREIHQVELQYPKRFLRLRYEDLISDPESNLGRVCQFLGVQFDSRMLSFHESKPDGFHGEGSHWFEKLGEPLDADQAEKWREQMDPRDLQVADRICGQDGRLFGYEPRPGRGSSLDPVSRAGLVAGWASVAAEKLIFHGLPAELRMRVINSYRSRTGRV